MRNCLRFRPGVESLETRILPVIDPLRGLDGVLPAHTLAAVAKIGGSPETLGTGVLIAPNWVLTAAHVVSDFVPGRMPIEINHKIYFDRLGGVYVHPAYTDPNRPPNRPPEAYDLALIHLSSAVPSRRDGGADPIPIYGRWDHDDPGASGLRPFLVGTKGYIVGYGLTGTGTSGAQSGSAGYRRGGRVKVSGYKINQYDFEFEEGQGLSQGARGDSGGPFLVGRQTTRPNGAPGGYRYYVAGITVTVTGDRYGAATQSIQTQAFTTWIEAHLYGAGNSPARHGRYVVAPDGSPQLEGGLDDAPPVLSPATVYATATGPAGAAVVFSPSVAADDLDLEPALTYSVPSGSVFPVGETRVTVTATDAAGQATTAAFSVVVDTIDLAVTDLRPTRPDPVFAGRRFYVEATVANRSGPATSVRTSPLRYYLSRDAVIDDADTFLDVSYLDSDPSPGTATLNRPFLVMPAGTPPGDYFLGVVVEPSLGEYEADAGNNVRTMPLTVASLDDFALTFRVAAGQTLVVSAADGVLGGLDSPYPFPPEARPQSFPSHAQHFSLARDGSFSYTPAAGFAGVDEFIARLALTTIPSRKVVIEVAAPPAASPDHYATAAGTGLTVAAGQGVLANDFEATGQPLEAELLAAPAHGELHWTTAGSFTFLPSAGFAGMTTFSYRPRLGGQTGNPATVTVVVGEPPVGVGDSFLAVGGSARVSAGGGVLANDQGRNGLPLEAHLVAGPSHGRLTLRGDGSFDYTADEGFAGTDQFTYAAHDGGWNSAAVTVRLGVIIPPPSPAPGPPPPDPQPPRLDPPAAALPSVAPPPPRSIHLSWRTRRIKGVARMFVIARDAATNEVIREWASPFSKGTLRAIRLMPADLNADGTLERVVLTAKKGHRKVVRVFSF